MDNSPSHCCCQRLLKRMNFDKFYCLLHSGPRAFLSFKPVCKFDLTYSPSVIIWLSQQKERHYLKVKQKKEILFWMFQYHVLHRLHEVWTNIFIISKNLGPAELVQNQAKLSPVFNCVLRVQSLKKPEMGMNIWYHLLLKSLPHLGYF